MCTHLYTNLMVFLSDGYPLPILPILFLILAISLSLFTLAIIEAAETAMLLESAWCEESILALHFSVDIIAILNLSGLTSHESTKASCGLSLFMIMAMVLASNALSFFMDTKWSILFGVTLQT